MPNKTQTYSFALKVLPQRQWSGGANDGNPVPRGAKPDSPTKMGEFSYRDYTYQIVQYHQDGAGLSSADMRLAGKIMDALDDTEDGGVLCLPSEQWVWLRDQLKKKRYPAAVKEWELYEDDVLALQPDSTSE